MPAAPPVLSVVCAPDDFVGDLPALHAAVEEVLDRAGRPAEFLYVLAEGNSRAEEGIRILSGLADRYPVRVFRAPRGAGMAARLQHAFREARGRLVLTVPSRFQVDPSGIRAVLERLDAGDDVVATRREPRTDPWLNRVQNRVFHALVRRMAGRAFRDLTCGLRGMTAEAARSLDLYGDLHRFIPVVAATRGYRVSEVPVPQGRDDADLRLLGARVYAGRLIDLVQVFFITRYTRKPLRLFGLVGLLVAAVGAAIGAVLAALYVGGRTGLSDRPLLLLAVLLVVLGVQLIATGLVGEIVAFLAPRDEIVEATEMGEEG